MKLKAVRKMRMCKPNNQEVRMSYYRTPEHRVLRAKLVRRWKPWGKPTGPKFAAGKKKVSRNGYKGSERAILREAAHALREQAKVLKYIE